jgi:hypothetical protein
MGKIILVLILLSSTFTVGFSQVNDYNNGNGSILETKIERNVKWVIRKHIQIIKIGDLANNENLNIIDNLTLANGNIIGKLKLNDTINITQIAETTVGDVYYVFLKIEVDDKINGWIFFDKGKLESAPYFAPYYNNRWEILERINVGERTWTCRRIEQIVSVWEVLNIRDKPGLIDTKVISKIIPPKYPQVNVNVLGITEENDTIDGKQDRWLKIDYNGITGWIFGGYSGVERDGPKYYFPESLIYFGLGWY